MKRLAPLLLVFCALLTGCSALAGLSAASTTAAAQCGRPAALMLIIGAHRDAPRPSLGPVLLCQAAAAIRAAKPVKILVAAGQPEFVRLTLANGHDGSLAQQAGPWVAEDVQRVQQAVAAARPAYPGADDLAALAVAADEARSIGDPHADLALIDSGLDDRGALDFTVPGLLAATPAEVVGQLKDTGNLPDLDGFSVLLVGLGYTAPPQQPLSAKWRSNLTAIWTAVVTAAGAKVDVIPQPGLGPSLQTDEPVRLIPVPSTPQVRVRAHATVVFTGESAVRFEPNTTVFADPAAALRALAPIARWLAADPSRHAWLEGTTADVGPIQGQRYLSVLRADKVRQVLISLGASAAQISTKGVGSRFRQFVPDRNAAGVLLAGPATLNRSVRITLS
jgi:outer membrane protein OmpA-like peptidoglycan-associated protein